MTKHDDEAGLAPAGRATQILVWLYGEHDPDATKEVHAYIAAQISAALAARDAEIEMLKSESEGRGDALASAESQVAELMEERDTLRAQIERMREALLDYSNILHSLEARGVELSEAENTKWEKLTCVEQTSAATAKEPQS